ncbi:MAG: hypothetical protein J0H71_05555 [Rhizobiales bacterium]|nr:hypothetical protein [Hyphomicrobiales bacterium]
MTAFSATAEYGTAEIPHATPSLACDGASFVAAGKAALVGVAIVAAVAAFGLGGQAMAAPSAMPAAPASFVRAGQAITMPVLAPMAARAFTVAGRPAEMAAAAAVAAFGLGGQAMAFAGWQPSGAAAFLVGTGAAQIAIAHAGATFALTGQSAWGGARHTAASASVSLYGGPVFPVWKIGLGVPGEPATAEYGTAEFPRALTYQVAAAATAFSWSGQPALLTAAPEAAPFVLTPGRAEAAMAVHPLAVALAGQPLLTHLVMRPVAGVFVAAPQPLVSLLPLDAGAFAWAGQDFLGVQGLERGAFLLAGQEAHSVKWLGVGPASFAWSGQSTLSRVSMALSRAGYTVLGWSISDVTGPRGAHVYLIEVQAHDGVSLRTFYLSTEGFTSLPEDAPPNQYYEPRIIDPGNFDRALFDGSTLRGRAKSGSGDIQIASSDPGNGQVLDDWFGYGWSRREIRIRSLPKGAKSISAASTLFVGKLDNISSTKPLDTITLKIGDRLADLEQPLLTDLFAGTTLASGATAEGNADLEGKIKQRCFGNCSNVPLQPANVYDLIYLASEGGAHAITVYDGGLPLIADGDSADLSALRAATIAGGHFRTCLASGHVRVGALPAKALTADVAEGATTAARSAGQIAYRMLRLYGVPEVAISTGSITALDTVNAAECGYFVNDDRTVLVAVQDVLDSIGAWMVPDRDGTLAFGRFNAPTVSPMTTFELDEVAIGDTLDRVDGDLPTWRVLVQYGANFSVQGDNDLLADVDAARRAFLAKDFRTTTAENTAIKTKHLSAGEVTIKTYLVDPAAAAAEASRQIALLSAERQRYDLTMPLADAWPSVPGDAITLRHPRLGLSSGKPFAVLARTDLYSTDTVQFSLWG